MKVTVKQITTWERVVDAARLTSHKPPLGREPQEQWKKRAILCEHSPIRLLEFDIIIEDIPTWVSVHLVRHFLGVEKFVTTQRDDRVYSDIPRGQKLQEAPVTIQMSCNAQALINISRKRLCCQASKETREVWEAVKKAVTEVDPIVGNAMVRECVYKGWCYELKPCGYFNTKKYIEEFRSHVEPTAVNQG